MKKKEKVEGGQRRSEGTGGIRRELAGNPGGGGR